MKYKSNVEKSKDFRRRSKIAMDILFKLSNKMYRENLQLYEKDSVRFTRAIKRLSRKYPGLK